jgi:opacity protein-like surface antigen
MNKAFSIFLFLFSFSAVTSRAQRLEGRAFTAFGSSYCGITNGITISNNESPTYKQNQFHPSYAFGAGIQYNLEKHWSIGLDFMYSVEGKKVRYTDFDNDVTHEGQTNYFRIPVNVAYYFRSFEKQLRPYLTTGVAFGILSSQNGSFTANNAYSDEIFRKEGIPVLDCKSFDFGLQLGVGVHYKIHKRSAAFAEIKYYRGVVDPYKGGSLDTRNENIRLQVGYAYCLKA